MKYEIPKSKVKKDDSVKSVMFRIPVDIFHEFNVALKKSNLSAQLLVESMVRHCLKEASDEPKAKGEP